MAARRQQTAGATTSSALIRSIRHVLRPIIRLMMRHGIVLQTFNQLIKSVYTEEAEKEITCLGGPATDLQISLMTGLHRKEVKRFREDGYDAFMLSPTLSTGADVVTRWLTDRRFLSARREPKSLSTRRGDTVDSFATLVRSIDTELRPSAVLAEMIRLGIVQADGERAQLVVDAFVPQQGFDDQVQYLAENGHDHLAAVVHNLGAPKAPMLEQSISATELSTPSAQELERIARSLWKLVMQQLMERAVELEARDKLDGVADTRINFGAYFYKESVPKPEGSTNARKRTGKRTGAKHK
ncbi:MAG: DUF6502 family protein [Betaproteobacteria bacterium]